MKLHAETLRIALYDDELEQYWTSCLNEYEDVRERATLLEWVREIRNDFITHATYIDDPEDLIVSVALSYIELKSKWQMLNTQINYQVFRTGEAPTYLIYKSSILSIIVDVIGKFLSDEDLAKIHEFLLHPTTESSLQSIL